MNNLQEYIKVWEEQLDSIRKQLRKINIGESLTLFETIAAYGAENGWTIPSHTTMREIQEMIQGKSKKEMDKEFEVHYAIEENYEAMKKKLLSNVFEGRWKELFEDCFYNYEQGRFKITIPCLFSILEGTVFDIVQDQKWKQAFKEDTKIKEGSIKKPVLLSVQTFIVKAFSHGKFDVQNYKPALINRHWVLHGRDNVDEWQRVDSLRLFNALYSLAFLNLKSN